MDHSRATNGLRDKAVVVAFVTSAACYLFLQLGYAFETGDQLQYLLLPYRSIYPDFVPGDWFTWQTSHYHQTYAWLIRGLHGAAGEHAFPLAVACAQGCVLAWLCYAVLQVARALDFGVLEAAFAVIVFGGVREAGMAGALLNHGQLVPADLALPAFLLACAAWARGRWLLCGVWLGVSGFWHANFAVLAPLVLGPLVLEHCLRVRKPWPLLQLTLPFLIVASPTLLLLVGSFLVHDSSPEAVGITLFTRSSHHYDLWSMHAEDFYWPALLAAIGLPVWLAAGSAKHGQRLRLLVALCAVILMGVIGSGLHRVSLARLFAFRMSMPLLLLLLLTAARALRKLWCAAEPATLLWLCANLCALASFARTDVARLHTWGFGGVYSGAPAVAPLLCAALLARYAAGHWRTGVVVLATITLLWSASLGRARVAHARADDSWTTAQGLRSLRAPIHVERPDRPLFAAIRARTPHDARILAPAGMIDLRLLARRAVFVDWKCAPMKGDEAREWQRRMLAAMGTRVFPATGYALRTQADRLYWRRPLPELAALARREGMTHVIAARGRGAERQAGVRLVFTDGPYAVYELAPR
ncbi:MAG TPA: DUF6798 domain-containing protein [Polyangiales bacterium]